MQIMTLDETLTNKQMIESMGVVRDHLNTQNMDKTIEEAEELNDDIQEAMEMQQELTRILGTSIIDYDEDELNAELEELDFLQDDGLLYGQQPPQQNKKIENKPKLISIIDEEVEVDTDSDDEQEKEIKKLEIEMNQNGNTKNLIDVQIVTSSTKNRMMIESY
eukprot:294543_1